MVSSLAALTASMLIEHEPVRCNFNQFSHSGIQKESDIPGHGSSRKDKVPSSFCIENNLKPESKQTSIKIIFTKPGTLKAVEHVRLLTLNFNSIGDWRGRNVRLIVATSK